MPIWLICIILAVIVIAVAALLVATYEVSKRPTIVREQPIVQNPVENTYNLYYENKTIQNINQEYLIKGDREMICIASPESPDKMICYKQR